MNHKPYGVYEKCFKRLIDFMCSLCAVLLFFWLYAILIILGTICMRGNPFFIQERPGKEEKIFKLIKFRTMDNRKNSNGELLPDEVRLNKYGRFLRTTSLDELPELFNILKGDMSIVGPRPLLIRYLPFYSYEERTRHAVRPGLTGLAQVNGRNNLEWDERLNFDVVYVSKITFLGDLKIIRDTVVKVLNRSDIASGDELVIKDLDVEREITIKNIDISEIVKFEENIRRAMEESNALNFPENDSFDSKSRFAELYEYMRIGSAKILIAFENNKFAGYAWYFNKDINRIHLNEIAVLKSMRGRHVGTALIKYLEDIAEHNDKEEIELFCMESNESAGKFYMTNDFYTEKRLLVKRLKKDLV